MKGDGEMSQEQTYSNCDTNETNCPKGKEKLMEELVKERNTVKGSVDLNEEKVVKLQEQVNELFWNSCDSFQAQDKYGDDLDAHS